MRGHRLRAPLGGKLQRDQGSDDEKVSTPVGDQPRRDGAGSRGVPGRTRRSRDGVPPGVEPVTVEQLVARSGGPSTGRRRAARRVEEPAPVRPEEIPEVRSGLPPVPGAPAVQPTPQAGLPPVPGAGRASPQLGLPPVPVLGSGTALWEPEGPPSRRSGPIPPLPGLLPPPGTDAAPPRPVRARRPERPPASPGRRRLVRALIALAAVLGIVVLDHLGLYFYVDQKIGRVEALATDGPEVLAPALQA
ncbi:MAG: hypothetical protein ACLGI3_18715, partial [Actinomycetes bacterium]